MSLRNQAAARVVLVASIVALGFIFWTTRPGAGDHVSIAGAPFVVGNGDVSKVDDEKGATLAFDVVVRDGQSATRVRLWKDSTLTIVTPAGARHSMVHVVSVGFLYEAIAAFLAMAAVIPYAVWPKQTASGCFGPWYQLLSEPKGGYSLARFQLLLWFLPVAVLYGAFSFVSRSFMPIGTQLEVLLGLSGATTVLGTAASPSDGTHPPDASPTLSDLITDWSGHGDVSRYQYLLLSVFGAIVLVTAFLSSLAFPELPAQFLYLIAASQGTYVTTKAVKQAKADDPGATTATSASKDGAAPVVVHAPAQITAAGAAAPSNTVAAPEGMGSPAGSFAQTPSGR